ncbi:SH3 domain-containing protein [Mucilaginibacter boryungensis]|uniref:DnaJ domain-containing protein n=1 Tax=Mucilaginibacter boryungensis TaxID=768480 RepID=A0ABR9XK56_9SPHI|nr:SH3 domain-containing protein [Mucilaginibacter boryungensis]MBE9667582.1 DnaJ domain-containing protein [Mucilaginibacter boryungensis]
MKDFYYLLGTDSKATPQEINSAYRKLAKKFDQDGGEYDHFLDSHFREITEAYQLLSDPVRRRKYDIALKKAEQRRFYWWFRVRHLTVAASLALACFTSLFGWYVINSLKGSKKALVVKTPMLSAAKVKHHKKKKLLQKKAKDAAPLVATTIARPIKIKRDTPVIKKVAPVIVTAKQAPLIATQPVVTKQPAIIKSPVVEPDNETYTATIQANMTGIVNLHQQSGYTSAVIASIPNHSQVKVLERGQSFYKVFYNGQTGYVPKWTIPTP